MKVVDKRVLIFKSAQEDQTEEDTYISVLKSAGFIVECVPVLEFEYINLPELKECLERPDNFSGLVFTSQRAIYATEICLGSELSNTLKKWSHTPVFVVGERSACAVQQKLGLSCEGMDSGSAENLCSVILQRTYLKPLLFPCGNLKRDVLPTRLAEKGISLHCVITYITKSHTGLASSLQKVLGLKEEFPEFLVFFSPSGVEFSLSHLKKLGVPLNNLKCVALGPATEKALHNAQLNVYSTCKKPKPEQLLQALAR